MLTDAGHQLARGIQTAKMAALQASLLLVLAAACGLTAAQSSASCELVVDVVYPSGGSPYPVCSSQCDSDQSGIWYQGVALRRFSTLRDEYQLMVAAEYQNGDLVSCSLVPYKTTEQLLEEAAARAECLGTQSSEGKTSDQNPSAESVPVPEAPVAEETTSMPTTPEPTTTIPFVPTTPAPTTPEPTTPVPTTPAPTTPEPTTPVSTTPAPTTPEPTTPVPTTPAPTTPVPTTPAPTTPVPTTPAPTTTPTTTTTTTTPAPTTTKTTTTTTTTPKPIVYTCPSGHYKFKDASCYMVPTVSYEWEDAYKYCKDRGYTLAKIESLDEQKFAAGLINDDMWIDLNDRSSEGKFRFSDGSATPFTYWESGEPNDYFWREDCVEMQKDEGFKWNDKNCGNKRRFVCEKPTTIA